MKKSIMFSNLSNEWLCLKRFSVKHSTFIKYRNIIDLYLIDYFDEKDINELNDSDLCYLFDQLFKKKSLSSSVLKSTYCVMKMILVYGEEKYNLKRFNFSYIKIPAYKQEIVILLKEEEKALIEYCKNHLSITTLAIFISLYTGLRLGEVCGLKWGDIDLDKGYINVSRTVQRVQNDNNKTKTEKMISDPKTQLSKRTAVMSDVLIAYINRYKMMNNKDIDHQSFLLSNNMDIPEPRNIQRNFKNICDELKIKINFHVLRHTFATNCVKYGVDTKTLCELLGHSNISTTLNLYVHPTLEDKREQINKIFQ